MKDFVRHGSFPINGENFYYYYVYFFYFETLLVSFPLFLLLLTCGSKCYKSQDFLFSLTFYAFEKMLNSQLYQSYPIHFGPNLRSYVEVNLPLRDALVLTLTQPFITSSHV